MNISEIAKLANVSKAAVSFALNGKPGVSEETRNRIMSIVNEHGYSYNKLVKTTQELNKTILLCMGSRTKITTFDYNIAPFFHEFLRVIERKVNEAGYMLVFKTVIAPEELKDEKVIQAFQSAAGTILIATDLFEDDVVQLMSYSKALVVVDSMFPTLNISCVVQDNYFGAYKAVEYLISQGHTNIGYIGTEDPLYNCVQRRLGFQDALKKYKLPYNKEHSYFVDAITSNATIMLNERLKHDSNSPTAYFAESDYLAIALINSLQSRGIQIPEDVSIIGYDNIQISGLMTPALSTINMPKEKVADVSIALLLERFNSKDQECGCVREIILPELILRDTCKPLS